MRGTDDAVEPTEPADLDELSKTVADAQIRLAALDRRLQRLQRTVRRWDAWFSLPAGVRLGVKVAVFAIVFYCSFALCLWVAR